MRFPGVDDVGELDGVLDEEHRDGIADQVVNAFGRVELGGEPPGVSDRVGRAPRAEHRREPDEYRSLYALGQEPGLGYGGGGPVGRGDPVGADTAGVDHSLWDPFVIEVRDLLAQVMVLEEDRRLGPAFSEWSESGSRAPVAVVRYAPRCATAPGPAPRGHPVGLKGSGPAWSALGGNGSWGAVRSSSSGGWLPGAPGTTTWPASGEDFVAIGSAP